MILFSGIFMYTVHLYKCQVYIISKNLKDELSVLNNPLTYWEIT